MVCKVNQQVALIFLVGCDLREPREKFASGLKNTSRKNLIEQVKVTTLNACRRKNR